MVTSATRQLALGVAIEPHSIDRFDQFVESLDGHVPALWAIRNDWGGADPRFPATLAEQVSARGSVPFVWWQPVTTGNLNDTTKANWIRSGYPRVYDRFPEIVALVYFNVDSSPVPTVVARRSSSRRAATIWF